MGIPGFGWWVHRTLSEDEKYAKHIAKFITPSKEAERKADISNVAGIIVGGVLGIGWRSTDATAIAFKEHPIDLMTMIEHKDDGKEKIRFFFAMSGATYDDIKKMEIKPSKKGVLRKEIVGVKLDYNCTGKERIENDEELMNKLLDLFRTKTLFDISDWTMAPITVEITKEKDTLIGKIEICMGRLKAGITKETFKLMFDCATKMAEHIQLTLAERGPSRKPMT